MGGLFSERSGVINIALEGMMLVAFVRGAAVAAKTGSPVEGRLLGVGAGSPRGIYGFGVITFRADQIVGGTAINMLAAGVTPFVCKVLYDSTSSTPALPIDSRFQWSPMFWAWAVVFATHGLIENHASGLWVRFAGEHPAALDSAGIRVNRIRWTGVLVSGALAGMGGATLSVFLSSSFSRNMTAGRGFMALAALIFGKWRPMPAAIACLLFGFTDALQIRLQGVVLWGRIRYRSVHPDSALCGDGLIARRRRGEITRTQSPWATLWCLNVEA